MRPAYGLEVFDSCQSCKWRSDQFFCNLPAEALEEFDALAFANVYPQGAILFAEGQAPRGVFMLCQGTVKLSVGTDDGRTLITRIARKGELLGMTSALSGNNHKTTAETLEPVQVNFLRRDEFLAFMNRHADASRGVIRQLTAECEAEADHVRTLGLSHSASEKLARLLLSWASERGKDVDGTTRLQMLMTHEDVSQMIGTSRETVTRLLKEFREKKIISTKGSTLTILKREELERFLLS